MDSSIVADMGQQNVDLGNFMALLRKNPKRQKLACTLLLRAWFSPNFFSGIHLLRPQIFFFSWWTKLFNVLFGSGSSIKNKQMFNIICELPETVARTLVPRMRVVKGSGKSVNYLTPPRILLAIVTSWLRRGRWFDDQVSDRSLANPSNSFACAYAKMCLNFVCRDGRYMQRKRTD